MQQEGDGFISDAAIRLNFTKEQRQSLLLISDLLIQKRKTIKYALWQGLIDESRISTLCWPVSVLSKRDISYWKRFILSISRGDG